MSFPFTPGTRNSMKIIPFSFFCLSGTPWYS